MPNRCRSLILGSLSMTLLSACAAGSYSSDTGVDAVASAATPQGSSAAAPPFATPATIAGSHDVALVTASAASVAVVVGGNETVSVTFTSSDGKPLSALAVSAAAGGLPAGWSSPANFTCAGVTTGSGCVLTLQYAPTAVASGTLTVNYVVIDNSGLARTNGSISIPYAATPSDNVVATASPSGEVDAVSGAGKASVTVNFTTDDGNAATNLVLGTDLGALPAGWSSASPNFGCAIVSTGSGCQLTLTYAPTAAVSGTLALAFAYTDDAGVAKTGSLNIPFRTTTANNVVATVAPSGQIIAVQMTGGQAVPVTFTTDDGKPASQLKVTTDLSKLPPGWSSPSPGFACASVGTGSGCQLTLKYAPTALASGALTVNYTYVDGAGAAQAGLFEIPYAATTNDNLVGTVSPAGQINAVVGMGTQAVTVSFATDDGRPATALQVTTDLTQLPPGWASTDATLSCSGINGDSPCTLPLTYAPTAAGSGTLSLAYKYLNNAGEAKTGTVSAAYRATTDDNVVGTPSQSTLAVRTGSTTPVTVTFATDDGNPASLLAISTALTALPAGWSAAVTPFACATVSAGTACTLSLTYAPTTAVTSSALNLAFGYTNDAGTPKTNTVVITYSASTPYLYVADGTASGLSACPLNVDDSIAACATTAASVTAPAGIALHGSFLYVTSTTGDSVAECTVGNAGVLAGCTTTSGITGPTFMTVNPAGTYAYIGGSSQLTGCAITAGTGTLSGCTVIASAFAPLAGLALSTDGTHAYAVHGPAAVEVCNVAMDGSLNACTPSGTGATQAAAVLAVRNGILYTSTQSGALYACPINADGSLAACVTTAAGTNAAALAFSDSTAYVSSLSAAVLACAVNPDGTFGACSTDADPTFSGTSGMVVR